MKLTQRKIEKAKAILAEEKRIRFYQALDVAVEARDVLNVRFQHPGLEPVDMGIVICSDGTWHEADKFYKDLEPSEPQDQHDHSHPHP